MALSITVLSIMALSIMALSIMALSIMALRVMALNIILKNEIFNKTTGSTMNALMASNVYIKSLIYKGLPSAIMAKCRYEE